MRDILSKVVTGSMIAGAALLVTACGGGNQANNTATDNLSTDVYNADVPADLNSLGGGNLDTGLGNTGATGSNTSTTTTGGAGNSTTTTTTTTNTTTANSAAGNNQ